MYRFGLLAILIAYFTLGYLYASRTPAWQVPDEPAHYNYVQHIARTGTFPVLEASDYDEAYRAAIVSERFPPEKSIAPLTYEDHQPPLYYLLAAPVFNATGGNLLALRLFSLVLGSGVIVFTFLSICLVAPHAPVLALTAAGIVAFVPQHLAMMSGVNNDSLAELLMSVGLWLTLRQATHPNHATQWGLGVVLGLAFLTKTTVYPLAVLIGLMILFRAQRSFLALIQLSLPAFLPAFVLGALWWVRNILTYGGLDVLGLQRHDAIVFGQFRTANAVAQWGLADYLQRFLQTTFQSFWGQFGWMGVVMDQRVYGGLFALCALALLGMVAAVEQGAPSAPLTTPVQAAFTIAAANLCLGVALYVYYNLTFVQFQGRYMYPALPVMAFGLAVGLRQWAQWGTLWVGRLFRRWLPAAYAPTLEALFTLLPVGALGAVAGFALYRFILPALQL